MNSYAIFDNSYSLGSKWKIGINFQSLINQTNKKKKQIASVLEF